MNRKLLLSVLSLFLTFSTANASDKIHVSTVGEFSTVNPADTIDVRVLDDSALGSYDLKTDDIIHCNVIKVTSAKRGKRSASFTVTPISYTTEGHTITVAEKYYGKYSAKVLSKEELKNIDAKKVGIKAASSVGNYFVKGVAPAVSLAEGMIKNEDGNRLESGVKQVYKDSPLSYVEKGKELELTPEDEFYLVFKPSKSEKTKDIEEISNKSDEQD